MNIPNITRVIDGTRYSARKADVVASDCYWDGRNFERGGRNTWLMKTKKGNFFMVYGTFWQGERDHLEPVSVEEAIREYERLPESEMIYEEAFDTTVEEA